MRRTPEGGIARPRDSEGGFAHSAVSELRKKKSEGGRGGMAGRGPKDLAFHDWLICELEQVRRVDILEHQSEFDRLQILIMEIKFPDNQAPRVLAAFNEARKLLFRSRKQCPAQAKLEAKVRAHRIQFWQEEKRVVAKLEKIKSEGTKKLREIVEGGSAHLPTVSELNRGLGPEDDGL